MKVTDIILVTMIVGASLAYLVFTLTKSFRGKGGKKCGGCS